jgi:trigger factor
VPLKIKVTEPKTWQRVLEIEIPAAEVKKKLEAAFQEYQQRIELPGFRKGKVPLSLVKTRYADTVQRSVLQDLIPQAWEEARQKENLVPIAEPAITEIEFEPDKPLKFKASVEIRPNISLEHVGGLKATKREVKVAQEDVNRNLRALQERHATVEPSQDKAGEMDIVLVDTWKVDEGGIPIVGQQSTDIPIDLGAPHIIKEYREALVNSAPGDQRRVTVTYPQDHPKKELAGQKVSYLVKVKEITKKTLPPLDDDFAKAVGDFKTLNALREELHKSLQQQEEQRAKRDVQEQIIDQIIENNPFEVPESMVAGYIETLIADFHPGEKKDEDRDQLRRSYRPLAVRAIKRWFILEEVCKKENLTVADKELQAEVASMAKARDIDPQQLQAQLARSDDLEKLRRNMEEEKTLAHLLGKAEVTTAPAEPERQTAE